jgi:hypothetical protein
MSPLFETEKDRERELKAITKFVERFNGSFKKLDPFDVDYRVYNDKGNLIAYVEVKGRLREMSNAYPLPISATKVTKLCAKRLNPVLVWACEDGIIYGKVKEIVGKVRWGGREPREDAYSDEELMLYYSKQKTFKYAKYY